MRSKVKGTIASRVNELAQALDPARYEDHGTQWRETDVYEVSNTEVIAADGSDDQDTKFREVVRFFRDDSGEFLPKYAKLRVKQVVDFDGENERIESLGSARVNLTDFLGQTESPVSLYYRPAGAINLIKVDAIITIRDTKKEVTSYAEDSEYGSSDEE